MTMLQYNCKWNSHATNMMNSMHSLRDVENFVDVTLISEGRTLKAHKIVLSTCSSLFHQMFLGNPCAHPIVFLADLKFSTLKVIIDFIYTGEISIEESELEVVLKAAKALDINGLTDICREKLVAQAQTNENGSKGPVATPYRSPRKKRPRTQSNEVRVQFDDPGSEAKQGGVGAADESDVHAENGSAEEEEGKPAAEEQNVRIRQPVHEVYPKLQNQMNDSVKRRRRRSHIWNYFTPKDQSIARCDTCYKEMSYRTSISNLSSHLRSMHPTLDMSLLQKNSVDGTMLTPKSIKLEESVLNPVIHKL